MDLQGKTLFITGASRGIGLAIAKRAARDGANIVIAAKTTEPNPKLPGTIYSAAEEIEAAGGQALPLQCRHPRRGRACWPRWPQAVERFGGIDILVNNASAISLTPTPAHADEALRPDVRRQRARHLPAARRPACRELMQVGRRPAATRTC